MVDDRDTPDTTIEQPTDSSLDDTLAPPKPSAEMAATVAIGTGSLTETPPTIRVGSGRTNATVAIPSGPRYELGALLGLGGMGEVVLARDQQIGREVAVKRIRSSAPSAEELARFIREALVQGRLEHPA